MTAKLTTPAVLLLIAAGCGGQIGEENVNDNFGCELSDSTPLGEDEASDLGPTPAELRAWIDGEHSSTVSWEDDTESAVTVTVTTSGDATWNTYSSVTGDGDQPAIDIACESDLSVPATIKVTTEDGRLDESWTGALKLSEGSFASFYQELDTLTGTLDVESFITETDYDAFDAHFSTTLHDDGTIEGEVIGTVEGTDGTGPDSTSWQGVVPIGTFGSDLDEQ